MRYPKVTTVTPMDNYRLSVVWENGESGIFDCTPYLIGSWYGQLLDIEKFKAVRPCGCTVEWTGGQDIAPHELYDLSER